MSAAARSVDMKVVNLLPAGMAVSNHPRYVLGHPESPPSPRNESVAASVTAALAIAVSDPATPSTPTAGPSSDSGAQGGARHRRKVHKPPAVAPEDRSVCAPVNPSLHFAHDDSPSLRMMKRLQQRRRSLVVIAEQFRAPKFVFTTTLRAVIRNPSVCPTSSFAVEGGTRASRQDGARFWLPIGGMDVGGGSLADRELFDSLLAPSFAL